MNHSQQQRHPLPVPSIIGARSIHPLFTAAAILLLLTACSAMDVKMSKDHVAELNRAFVGREFVFRTDWHKGMVIYQGKTVNNLFFTMYHQTHLVKTEKGKLGNIVAMGGEVATVTKVLPIENYRLYLGFKTKQGRRGALGIISQNNNTWKGEFYADMTDQSTSVAWVEEQLTRNTIKFFDPQDKQAEKKLAELPPPPEQLRLTPTPKHAVAPAAPAITYLRVNAQPPSVKRGDTVSLSMEYRIGPPQVDSVEVSETRYLSLTGKLIPRYPKKQTKALSAGDHGSSYRQKIPVTAQPGLYTYRGEVCLNNSCSTQSVEFTVIP